MAKKHVFVYNKLNLRLSNFMLQNLFAWQDLGEPYERLGETWEIVKLAFLYFDFLSI